jgi:hypothetical protein
MTDHSEEQEMEQEALEAIFGEDCTIVSPTVWMIKLQPSPGEPEDVNFVECNLTASIPPTYPDIVPSLSIQLVRGLWGDAEAEVSDRSERALCKKV